MTISTLEDLETLVETTDIECKAAQGKSGDGEIPDSLWETYSVMANTAGGEIFLGIEETKDHRFICKGIKNPQKMQKAFWDTIHSKVKISKDILTEKDLQILTINEVNIIHITIPRAKRQERPIYIGKNPLGNTYIRRHEGDYKADDETVKRIMAEAVEDSRDSRILEHYDMSDLDQETINAYRNRFSAIKKDNPWIDLPTEQFLQEIGAIGTDRQTGKTGIRLAGLLMFGRYETIREEFPFYFVDYQEKTEKHSDVRWTDRITPDSSWSGNLHDFYQKTIRKLTADLKIPFRLQNESRIDDTPIHQAIREALTNTLIHADYSGLMRVDLDQALNGGISDCRNHYIQDMFRYVGFGDNAGSGIPIILKSWKTQHWKNPVLFENRDHETTTLELSTVSLFPEESIRHLKSLFGTRFDYLTELERIILVTTETGGAISHARIKSFSPEHPKDISAALTLLTKNNFLIKKGSTRDSLYYLPDNSAIDSFGLFERDEEKPSDRLGEKLGEKRKVILRAMKKPQK